jgi:hypothetical protein
MMLTRAPRGRSSGMAAAFALLLLAGGGCARAAPPAPPAPATVTEQVELEGWFHTVWNGSARHYLVDERGGSVELLLDEDLLGSSRLGVPFDRHHVTVIGRWVDEAAPRLAVHAIRHSLPGSVR